MAGDSGKIVDQGFEQLQSAASILFGPLEIAKLAAEPATNINRHRQLVADLTVLGIVGMCPFQFGDGLVTHAEGRRDFAVEAQKNNLALESLAKAQVIVGSGRWVFGIGEGLLDFGRLEVKRVGSTLSSPWLTSRSRSKVRVRASAPFGSAPRSRDTCHRLDHLDRTAVCPLRLFQSPQRTLDVSHLLKCLAVLEPSGWIADELTGRLFVIIQYLFEYFLF